MRQSIRITLDIEVAPGSPAEDQARLWLDVITNHVPLLIPSIQSEIITHPEPGYEADDRNALNQEEG